MQLQVTESVQSQRRLPGHPARTPRKTAQMTVEQWIARYQRAWETADADEIVDLFAPGASYRTNVFREPYVGSDAIRQYWQRGAGNQRGVAVRMGRPIVTPDRVAVEWWATLIDPDEGEITLPGCLLLRFAPDGRCSDLWEYWHVKPGRQDPPGDWGA
jgi:SnoaL-like domain